MNAAQIHLGLNYLPFVLILIASPLLAIALWKKSKELKTTATLLFILSALITIPVYLSGGQTEKIAEHIPNIAASAVHEHELAAGFALGFIELLGILSLACWLYERFKRPLPKGVWWGLVFLGFFNLTIFLRTGHLGGLIRHPEIIDPLQSPAAANA